MAVSTTNAYSGPYAANGVTVAFPFDFTALLTSDVGVILRSADGAETIVDSSQFTVTLNGTAPSDGTVTFDSPPAPGLSVIPFLDPGFTQDVQFEDGSAWLASPVNDANDAGALRDQYLKARVDKLTPPGVLTGANAAKFLSWDVAGNPIASAGTGGGDAALRQDLAEMGDQLVAVSNPSAPSYIRDLRTKLAELTSVKDFGGDDATAWNAARNSGARKAIVPAGDYGFDASVIMAGEGFTFEGENDYRTTLTAFGGSAELFQIGVGDNVVQHMALRNFNIRADADWTGKTLIRVKRAFQIYLERIRYKGSHKRPTEAIVVLDNNGGTSEQPVRTTFRDWYIDGADYNPAGQGPPVSIAFWNTGGIQTLFENTHVQDCQIGWRLGVDPAVDDDYYDPAHPNDDDFYDLYITNNCRYQVGDRGGTTNQARALDIWRGSGVHVSQSQIFLNNNGPDPALPGQRIAVFNHPEFGVFSFDQNTVAANARAEHFFETRAGAKVGLLSIGHGNWWTGLVGGKGMVKKAPQSSIRTIVAPGQLCDNPNNYGVVDQRVNAAITCYNPDDLDENLSAFDLGTASTFYYQANDGAARTFDGFANGLIGESYSIVWELTGGSTVKLNSLLTKALRTASVNGRPAGTVSARNGDVWIVSRANLSAAEYYTVDIIRGGALPAHADDAAAAAGGIDIGEEYRTASAVKVRVA